MSNELKNILSTPGQGMEDILKKYLSNELTDAERHAVEEAMLNDPLLEDALEGLQGQSPDNIGTAVNGINQQFRKTIAQKRKDGKKKNKLTGQSITIFAIVLIILLSVIAYLVIRKFS